MCVCGFLPYFYLISWMMCSPTREASRAGVEGSTLIAGPWSGSGLGLLRVSAQILSHHLFCLVVWPSSYNYCSHESLLLPHPRGFREQSASTGLPADHAFMSRFAEQRRAS